jgi:hypothetical protein
MAESIGDEEDEEDEEAAAAEAAAAGAAGEEAAGEEAAGEEEAAEAVEATVSALSSNSVGCQVRPGNAGAKASRWHPVPEEISRATPTASAGMRAESASWMWGRLRMAAGWWAPVPFCETVMPLEGLEVVAAVDMEVQCSSSYVVTL